MGKIKSGKSTLKFTPNPNYKVGKKLSDLKVGDMVAMKSGGIGCFVTREACVVERVEGDSVYVQDTGFCVKTGVAHGCDEKSFWATRICTDESMIEDFQKLEMILEMQALFSRKNLLKASLQEIESMHAIFKKHCPNLKTL